MATRRPQFSPQAKTWKVNQIGRRIQPTRRRARSPKSRIYFLLLGTYSVLYNRLSNTSISGPGEMARNSREAGQVEVCLELSWVAVWITYLVSWAFGWLFERLCQKDIFNIENYDFLVRELKFPLLFVLWSITSWAFVPRMCSYTHQHCTNHWLTVFEIVFAATIVVSVVWFTKALLLKFLYIDRYANHGRKAGCS